MNISAVLKVFLFSLVLALISRFGYLGFDSWQNERRTSDLCAAVGNYLETGNLREAFEGLQYGAARSGSKKVCISILDNGRSYAPNCEDQAVNYQTITCRAEANTGVRALVMYPREDFFGRDLAMLWGWLTASLLLLLYLTQAFSAYLGRQLLAELHVRVLGEAGEKKGAIGRLAEWILYRAGILQLLRKQAQDFENEIKEYRNRLVTESALRSQKEIEAAKAEVFVERIRKIRHDIRSPLSGLLAVQEALDPKDDLLYSTFSSVVRGLRSLVEKLNNLEIEEQAPQLTIVEVVAEEAVRAVRMKFLKRKNISLNLSYDAEKLSPVFAVPDALHRIFENLLENAFDAVPVNGTINLSVISDATDCRVFVEDTGCGIDPEFIPKLFQEGATFGKVAGTGLGLYHAKKSLEAWRGSIAYEARDSAGARISIRLPLAQTGVVFKGKPNARRLVVIDDDLGMPASLSRAGYEVSASAATFEDGLTILRQKTPADVAILVDQDLAGRRGTDLIAEAPGRPSFLCTNDFDNPDVVQRARQVGAVIIPKPILLPRMS